MSTIFYTGVDILAVEVDVANMWMLDDVLPFMADTHGGMTLWAIQSLVSFIAPIEELVAEEASQIDSHVIRDGARSQRAWGKTRRLDAEGHRAFSSAEEALGGDPEGYEDFSERGTIVDQDEEFRPPSQARPLIIVPTARRKRLARKPRVASRASDMDLAGDDPASDGGNIYSVKDGGERSRREVEEGSSGQKSDGAKREVQSPLSPPAIDGCPPLTLGAGMDLS
ncbi:uncharacterized protein A4U43_C06F13760 [Asparagus officinalis]|uniref:Uncharacterized protein n=1 Tax=Asparagus officinalis TaxID=4686 RepID=A0A5P1EP61_ASPOF|nr:uncharacterized protein A4U43_C06F13760 [Asparagus officinalis]